MAVLASELKKIFAEDIAANGSLSEGLLAKIGSTLNSVIDNHLWQLGDVRPSVLTEAQFAAQNGYDIGLPMAQRRWVRIEGQSISGSALSALTGITSLPNALAYGAHLEQTKSSSILQYFSNQNKSHSHYREMLIDNTWYNNGGWAYPPPTFGDWAYQQGGFNTSSAIWQNRGMSPQDRLSYDGGDVARPNSITVNFFLKINN